MTQQRGHELLALNADNRPVTPSGTVGCIMLVMSGSDGDRYWFQYRTGFFSDPITVQWTGDDMLAIFPAEIAQYLVKNNYARHMTTVEMQSYNADVQKETKS